MKDSPTAREMLLRGQVPAKYSEFWTLANIAAIISCVGFVVIVIATFVLWHFVGKFW